MGRTPMKKPRDDGIGWSAGTIVVSLGGGLVVGLAGVFEQLVNSSDANITARRSQIRHSIDLNEDFLLLPTIKPDS
jgi:hypothetical protein